MSRKPNATPFNQQKLDVWQPKISINGLIFNFIITGLIFIPLGFMLFNESGNVEQFRKIYDSSGFMDIDCSIQYANYAGNCSVSVC